MYFNPVIILALIIQGLVSKASRLAGAVLGFLITTGILVWGMSLYGQGAWITFFGIKLSQMAFIGACLVWYFFDVLELLRAIGGQNAVPQKTNPPATPAPAGSQAGRAPLIPTNAMIDPQNRFNDPYERTRPVNASTGMNKYCVVCGQEFGPNLESHCTQHSLLAVATEGGFRKRKNFYTLDGILLNEMDVESIRSREAAVFKRAKVGNW